MASDYPRHVSLDNRDMVRVIKDGGKIVSHVATSIRPVTLGGIQTKVAGIGAVASLPEARGKGYASKLMSDAVERSVERGADLMLISGDEGIYKRMHAVECGRFGELLLEKSDIDDHVPQYEISYAQSSDLGQCTELRQSLPTRYMLPKEDLEALFACKWVMDRDTDWWVVKDRDAVVGFAVIQIDGDTARLHDWAGSPLAFSEFVKHCFNQIGCERFVYLSHDNSLIPGHWRTKIRRLVSFDGTVLIIQAARLLERAKPFIEERVGETAWRDVNIKAESQRVVFQLDDETAVFENGGELAHLFFGQVEDNVVADKTTPGGRLRSLLISVFPLPLVWYGLGYV